MIVVPLSLNLVLPLRPFVRDSVQPTIRDGAETSIGISVHLLSNPNGVTNIVQLSSISIEDYERRQGDGHHRVRILIWQNWAAEIVFLVAIRGPDPWPIADFVPDIFDQ